MKKYDVIVIGGGTAGCAAAYTAGKLGLKTLLVEKNIHLGGSITSGLVVPAMFGGENQINTDFFNDLISEMHNIGGQITFQNNSGWLNPELCKVILDNMMLKAGVDILFNANINSISIEHKEITTCLIGTNSLSVYNLSLQNDKNMLSAPIETRYVIDSTGNCEIGKICGCGFLNKNDETQPINLRFIMSNINLDKFSKWLNSVDSDKTISPIERIDGSIHLSTAYTWDKKWALGPYFDDAVKNGVLKDTDRNYFQIFTIAGMPDAIAFNCPRIPENTDSENIEELSKALILARESIFRISKFCKTYFPGFENAYISNIADMAGIRVSNRIKGKYVYTIDDITSGKKFKNPVVRSNYPIDVHSAQKNSSTIEEVGEYELPIEALMSADIENLFVAGRCLSADFMAQGALRIQPSCFSMGEGVAKYIATHQS